MVLVNRSVLAIDDACLVLNGARLAVSSIVNVLLVSRSHRHKVYQGVYLLNRMTNVIMRFHLPLRRIHTIKNTHDYRRMTTER